MAVQTLSRSLVRPLAPGDTSAWRKTRRWIRLAAALVVVSGVIVGLRLTVFRPAAVPVTITRVQTGRVEEIVTNNRAGTITARRQALLSPEIGGRVVALPIEEGQAVKKGATLLVLADSDLRGQVTIQEQQIEMARAAAREVCTTADLAARDHDRLRSLLADGFVSRQAVDQAETERTTSGLLCAAATLRVTQASTSIEIARATLEKTVMRAPFDGVVSRLSTHLGEWVMPSPAGLPMPAAIELIDMRSLYVRAPLDEVDAGRIRTGQPVRITMDAYPGQSFAGRVTRTSAFVSEVQRQNRTFDVEVAFDDPKASSGMLPGTSADVEIILQAHDQVLRLPTSAILQGNRVLVVREGGLAAVTIESGVSNWEFTEVTRGLRAGEPVVVSLDRPEVREGARVRVEREAAK
jgi:HlyD family secretion protein